MKKSKQELYDNWIKEESIAHMKGWDFSHIDGRYEEEDDLPWDFREVIRKYLDNSKYLLDMETGGGEFLKSLGHPNDKTSAIEGYKPNVEYCKEVLLPLGIDFKEADGADVLPFEDEKFDVITNRHGDYNISELKRLLKKNGVFLTQQVGSENDMELVKLLLGDNVEASFPKQYLDIRRKEFIEERFEILESDEVFKPIKFYDVGALVWFARIIEWEFQNFSVDKYLDSLYRAQEILEEKGVIEGRIHRFYIVAKKR